jgi:RNA polymerase sigma-70 factor, ECF subfamily
LGLVMRDACSLVEQDLSAAQAGSRDALGRTLQAFRSYLLTIARAEIDAALQPKGSASDMVQETFLEASQGFQHFAGQTEAELRAWLRCLLLRRVSKLGRRFRSTCKRALNSEISLGTCQSRGMILPAAIQTPSGQIASDEEHDLLLQVLDRLPRDYQLIIQFRYRERRSFEAIGPLMGRSANAVRLLWLRAIERIKTELGSTTHE